MIKNKIIAVILILLGWASALVDGDATGFVFVLLIAAPMFFSKENNCHDS